MIIIRFLILVLKETHAIDGFCQIEWKELAAAALCFFEQRGDGLDGRLQSDLLEKKHGRVEQGRFGGGRGVEGGRFFDSGISRGVWSGRPSDCVFGSRTGLVGREVGLGEPSDGPTRDHGELISAEERCVEMECGRSESRSG